MRRGQSFARAFKRAVAVEYLQTGVKRQDIAMKYGLPSVQSVSNWVNCYLTPHEIETKGVSLPPVNASTLGMAEGRKSSETVPLVDQSATIEQLQKQLCKLERQLKFERDRNHALNVLIDIAEEQGIPVRKKAGAKQ